MDDFRLAIVLAVAVPFSRPQRKDLDRENGPLCVRFGFGRSKMNIPELRDDAPMPLQLPKGYPF